ncbi:MAG: ROK family transcriptional regulator, partial [Stappiaceae bacterium]
MRSTPPVGSSDGRGSNSVQVRRYNERIVLRELRRCGEASKAELARRANLTSAAVGTIIDELEAYRLIGITGKRHAGGRGQPATLYQLRAGGAYGIGVRLDRSSIETVLMDLTGKVIARRSHDPALPEPEKALDIVTQDIDDMLALLPDDADQQSPRANRVAGIGLAQPYNLGSWLRELALPPEIFLQWQEYDFRQALEDRAQLPVFAENDGTASAIAELFNGNDQNRESFLYMFVGPAIGGGVILNGDPLYGHGANAGDVATMPVPPSSLPSAPRPEGNWDILITR